ncbi:hypothetical protein ONS95_005135 [Cadophora gregata]|uniref:uncharacterized protein n=1 Tax=Cadophora gregata TaxID=51156 RepID=UPI0026DB7D56|nr:uncharacterized protein ONS95_005135 [Cadophora gregata]KAK0104869.1 hypothetical protein ONS95_005135 [Cadophora gregata]KAK0115052.1 hypothetical protein ONS96_013522 [Cadophora gregata f. sp. sojae]
MDMPHIPPTLKNRWPYVTTITKGEVDEAHEQARVYKDWFCKTFLHPEDDRFSNAIMVDRWSWMGPNYRDTLKEAPNIGRDYGFLQEFSTSFAGVPELVMCIGQCEYLSDISKRKEYAPVAASFIGAPGSEHMLMKMAEEFLTYAGIPTKVLTGKTAFPAPECRTPNEWYL